jgi:hypothetical protein
MLQAVEPGGKMRAQVEKGGPPAVRSLTAWLEGGAREDDFARGGLGRPGDPSPRDIIARGCLSCHNQGSGESRDLPYATDAGASPRFDLVSRATVPIQIRSGRGERLVKIAPMPVSAVTRSTHIHAISMALLALAVAGLFLLSGRRMGWIAVIGPLPMLAICLECGSWWLARHWEAFVPAIPAAQVVFGAGLFFQLAAVLRSVWAPGGESAVSDPRPAPSGTPRRYRST